MPPQDAEENRLACPVHSVSVTVTRDKGKRLAGPKAEKNLAGGWSGD
jgi:hypothetical protein